MFIFGRNSFLTVCEELFSAFYNLRASYTGSIFYLIKDWPKISENLYIPNRGHNRQKIGQAFIRQKIGPVEHTF
jgi:hypothetical protein